MKKGLVITLISVVLIILCTGVGVVSSIIKTSDNLEKLHNTVEYCESLVQSKLQERFDTVPNLVEIVKGSSNHEKEILTAIAEARTKYNNAFSVGDTEGMLEANESINTVVSKIEENYPEIAGLELYKEFMDEYSSLEAAITIARDNHNTAVRNYNDAIDMSWGSIIANMKGMEPEKYFEASTEAQNGVSIDMTD